jgi:hypothetical protein
MKLFKAIENSEENWVFLKNEMRLRITNITVLLMVKEFGVVLLVPRWK